jgi:hypothetical protein
MVFFVLLVVDGQYRYYVIWYLNVFVHFAHDHAGLYILVTFFALKKLYFCHFCDTQCVDIYCSGTLFAFFSYFEFIYPFNLHFSLFFLDIGFSSGLSPFFLFLFILLLSEDIGPYPSVVLDITISVAESGHLIGTRFRFRFRLLIFLYTVSVPAPIPYIILRKF